MHFSRFAWALLFLSKLVYAQLPARPGAVGYAIVEGEEEKLAQREEKDSTETDSACLATGTGQRCHPSHPGEGLVYGKCCNGNNGGRKYIYCHVYPKRPAEFKKGTCRDGEDCIQVNPSYFVCGQTS